MYDDEKEIEEDEEEVQESFFQKNKKMIIIVGIVLFIGILLMIVSGGSGNGEEKPVERKELALTLKYNGEEIQDNQEIVITRTGSGNVNAYNEENTTLGITWTSSDESVATVDPITGTVNGVSSGSAIITATYKKEGKDPITKSYQLKVIEQGTDKNIKLQGVISSGNALIMNVGMTQQLSTIYIPAEGYVEKLEYTSSMPVTAIVSNTGLVTAYTLGKTTITIKANNDSSLMTQVDVYVVSDNMASPLYGTFANELKFEIETLKVKIGETRQLKYMKDNEAAIDSYMKWTSSDENVATVDENGLLTAVTEGSTQITLSTITGVSAVMNVEVEKDIIEIERIGGLSSTIKIVEGEQYSIIPEISPLDASNKNLTFTSSNPSVASVNPTTGTSTAVIGISKGSAVITVESDNGKTATVTVDVTSKSSNTPTGGGSGEDCGKDSTKGYDVTSVDGNLYNCKSYAERWPSNGVCPSISFKFRESNVYLKICDYEYGTSECNPDNGTKISSEGETYKISGTGMRVVKIKQYGGSKPKTITFWYKVESTGSNCGGTSSTTKTVKISNCLTELKTATYRQMTVTSSSPSVSWKLRTGSSIATLTSGGILHVTSPGSVVVMAYDKSNENNYDTCTIKVVNNQSTQTTTTTNQVSNVEIKDCPFNGIEITPTETKELIATVIMNPSTATNKGVTWSSSNDKIVSVDDSGKITGMADIAGKTANIYATSNDDSSKKATCMVRVVNNQSTQTTTTTSKVTSISVTGKLTQKNGEVIQNVCGGNSAGRIGRESVDSLEFFAKVEPEDAANKKVNWTSSNKSVATVDDNGNVSVIGDGNAKITATAADGSEKYGTCSITVKSPRIIAYYKGRYDTDSKQYTSYKFDVFDGRGEYLTADRVTICNNTEDYSKIKSPQNMTDKNGKSFEYIEDGYCRAYSKVSSVGPLACELDSTWYTSWYTEFCVGTDCVKTIVDCK